MLMSCCENSTNRYRCNCNNCYCKTMEYTLAFSPDIIKEITRKKILGIGLSQYDNYQLIGAGINDSGTSGLSSQEYQTPYISGGFVYEPYVHEKEILHYNQLQEKFQPQLGKAAYNKIIFKEGCNKVIEEIFLDKTFVFTLDICREAATLHIGRYIHTNQSCIILDQHQDGIGLEVGQLFFFDGGSGVVLEVNESENSIFVEKTTNYYIDQFPQTSGGFVISFFKDGILTNRAGLSETLKTNLNFEIIYKCNDFNCQTDNIFIKTFISNNDFLDFPDEILLEHRKYAKNILYTSCYAPGAPIYGLTGDEQVILDGGPQAVSRNPGGDIVQIFGTNHVSLAVGQILTERNVFFYEWWLSFINKTQTNHKVLLGFGLQHGGLLSPQEWENNIGDGIGRGFSDVNFTGHPDHSNIFDIKTIDNQYIPTGEWPVHPLAVEIFIKYRIGHHNKYRVPVLKRREILVDSLHGWNNPTYGKCINIRRTGGSTPHCNPLGFFDEDFGHDTTVQVAYLIDENTLGGGPLDTSLLIHDLHYPDVQAYWNLETIPGQGFALRGITFNIDYYHNPTPTAEPTYLEKYPSVYTFITPYKRFKQYYWNGALYDNDPPPDNLYSVTTVPILRLDINSLQRVINEVDNYTDMDMLYVGTIDKNGSGVLTFGLNHPSFTSNNIKIVQDLIDEVSNRKCVDFGLIYKYNTTDFSPALENVWGESLSYFTRTDLFPGYFYDEFAGDPTTKIKNESDGFMIDILHQLVRYSEGCLTNTQSRVLTLNTKLDFCFLGLENYQLGDKFTIVEQSGEERKYILVESLSDEVPEGYRKIDGIVFNKTRDLETINLALRENDVFVTEFLYDKIKIYQTRARQNEFLKNNLYSGGVILTNFEEHDVSVSSGFCKGKRVDGTYILEPTEIYGAYHCRLQYVGYEYFHIIETNASSTRITLTTADDIEYIYEYNQILDGYWSLINYDSNCFEHQVPRDIKLI